MFVLDPENVERIAREILHSEAWWTAARAGLYADCRIVWADTCEQDSRSGVQACGILGTERREPATNVLED